MAEASANLGEAIVNHTVGSSAGGSDFQSVATPADPWWLQTLEATPGAGTTMLATGYRGANTIIGGGWGERGRIGREFGFQQSPDSGGSIRQGIRNNNPFNPRTWFRYGSQDVFGENDSYTPFQFMHKGTSWLANKDPGGIISKTTNRMGLGSEGDLISKGGLSRASAGARIGRMSERNLARTMSENGGTRRFLSANGYSDEALDAMSGNRRAVGQAVSMTGTGRINQAISGFDAGTRGGLNRQVKRGLRNELKDPATSVARKRAIETGMRFNRIGQQWAKEAGERAGMEVGEKLGARGSAQLIRKGGMKGAGVVASRAVGLAARAVPVLGWAMLAYDVANVTTTLAGAAVKGSVKLASEGMNSMRGGMRVGVMDQGFRDNSVSISSRARGVSAIQNSRLNARSVLGNEGAAMHAHFG